MEAKKEPLPPRAPAIKRGRMRGIQLRISKHLLLDWMGLEVGNIQLGAAAIDTINPDTLILVLRGNDERLPKIGEGLQYPRGTVVCTASLEKVGIQGEIMVEV